MERQYFAKYSERFARFDARRACVMAAWIFPGLRTIIENSVPASDRQMYSSAEMTEFFGGMALHDDNWEQLMAKYDERFGSIDE